ncbi:MAG: hypothetical protein H7Y09_07520 [Chitinophagaceae bacterium]|nr:hypothetical protein [Anaerolineae bacterium]
MLRSVGRAPGWSLADAHNLVPSCKNANSRKHDFVYEPNELIIYLNQALDKAPEVARFQKEFKQQRRADMLRAQLVVSLGNGLISEADITRALAMAASGENLVKLTSGLEIFEGVSMDQFRPSDIEKLLDTAVRLGADLPEGLTLSHKNGSYVQVRTAREYRTACTKGYYGETTFDMKMEAFFITALGLLEALAACRPSSQSFLRTPRVGVCDIDLLPSTIIVCFGDKLKKRKALIAAYPTVGKLVHAGKAQIARVTSLSVSVDFENMRTSLHEILRADLDGDGAEDLLVAVYSSAVGGTLGFGMPPLALARKGYCEPFIVTEALAFAHSANGPLES